LEGIEPDALRKFCSFLVAASASEWFEVGKTP